MCICMCICEWTRQELFDGGCRGWRGGDKTSLKTQYLNELPEKKPSTGVLGTKTCILLNRMKNIQTMNFLLLAP